jgi:hypothetical protein
MAFVRWYSRRHRWLPGNRSTLGCPSLDCVQRFSLSGGIALISSDLRRLAARYPPTHVRKSLCFRTNSHSLTSTRSLLPLRWRDGDGGGGCQTGGKSHRGPDNRQPAHAAQKNDNVSL